MQYHWLNDTSCGFRKKETFNLSVYSILILKIWPSHVWKSCAPKNKLLDKTLMKIEEILQVKGKNGMGEGGLKELKDGEIGKDSGKSFLCVWQIHMFVQYWITSRYWCPNQFSIQSRNFLYPAASYFLAGKRGWGLVCVTDKSLTQEKKQI